MNNSQWRRVCIVAAGLALATIIIIGRLVVFQIVNADEWSERGHYTMQIVDRPDRGIIYDRNGAVLAANTADYQISVAPLMVTRPNELATALSPILEMPRHQIMDALETTRPYVLLAGRVSAEVAEAVRQLPYSGLQIDPLPRRFYPQGDLMCHTLGYVDFEGNGGAGIEGYYQRELAGTAASARVNISPLYEREHVVAQEGADLVLTIDRSVQFTVEKHLARGVQQYSARGGTIVVMDPRSGAILAIANLPCFDPGQFYDVEESRLLNPIVSRQYEPGSVMKLITMAAALDSGVVGPQSTYYDAGVLEVGGHRTHNWDRSAPGTVDMTTLLGRSLNVGAATLATWMGPEQYYDYLRRFGFGRPTGIDLMSEATGLMPLPGDSNWTESFMATNSYGQGLAVTSLQMIAATAALANDGYMMQPYLVAERHTANGVARHNPTVLNRPISPETAHQISAMSVTAVAQEIYHAQIQGYTVAGKTGTAQIAEGGIYHPTDVVGSFIGWLPADAPEIIVYVKLDRPVPRWGSQTAAPLFSELVQELVVLLDIPPDNVRLRADVMAARNGGQ
ncbi:MAG: penicillin-binding protein 2 [Chloroflexota bacterium]